MNSIEQELKKIIGDNLYNDFGRDNFDEYRFADYQDSEANFLKKIKNQIKKISSYKKLQSTSFYLSKIKPYINDLQKIYAVLDDNDKKLMLSLLAYRLMGYKKIKLPTNNAFYKNALLTSEKLIDKSQGVINPNFIHYKLNFFDLNPININVKLFFTANGVAVDYIIEQYAYKKNDGTSIVCAEEEDVVLDLGGCWGDTALYFSSKVGEKGRVYSFEFIPNNINIFNKNLSLNPLLAQRINLVPNPVANVSNKQIYYIDKGPSSIVSDVPLEQNTKEALTISIDDFVEKHKLERVNLIKMDIEGSEKSALEGALNTIKKFKPKLAISIYHSMEDFSQIPNWILDLQMDYKLYLGHYTIHSEETVIFAI
jgi:FkbM family methyltransferase